MTIQDTALICLNGHLINDGMIRSPELNTKYCEKCGAKNISTCPECGNIIRGEIHYDDVYSFSEMVVPSYCHSCGKPYPWTLNKIIALKEMIEFSQLENEEKEEFNNNIELIVSDNPRTKLAAFKIKSFAGKLTKDFWDGLVKPLIIEIASETAKKTMGL